MADSGSGARTQQDQGNFAEIENKKFSMNHGGMGVSWKGLPLAKSGNDKALRSKNLSRNINY